MMKCKVLIVAAVMALLFSQTANAGLPVLIVADDFNRADGDLVGTSPPIDNTGIPAVYYGQPLTDVGGGVKNGGYAIVNNAAEGYPLASARVRYDAPLDRKYSIEATAFRRENAATNHSINIGFADTTPGWLNEVQPDEHPGDHIGGATGLTMSISVGGGVMLSENAFNAPFVLGSASLEDAGVELAPNPETPIRMLLEYDPVNNIARGLINGIELINIPYDLDDPNGINRFNHTWAGLSQSFIPGGSVWDDFAIREAVPEPASLGLALLGLGGMMLIWMRRRSR